MNIFQKCISLFIAVMTVFAAQAKNYEVASPSGDLRAVVSVSFRDDSKRVCRRNRGFGSVSYIHHDKRKQRVSNKSFMGHEF